ncbi:hypothetical protein L8W40_05660 [Campylobacter sp. IFREMER_LSEM_CL1846]|uniref:hypothetical protein n=1 Tax=unclassified Campylobacter TaxID=2593542 RepID=UPI0021E636D4|nr:MULTISPECIES: hypothetical protein [unclassified Campylobacter]HEC1748846.1 hypothetical protein [Campylobacter lari]MCV3428289.1 hypothetical protein [Campylobacter sp. IFREMER_LSEM_CL1904]MCV3434537.1 hypothetical protein [Campylobacter sp. IFREMER_LSEM_CL1846]HEC1768713.1 hypothetical protein [Campylobacter lari]HEC1785818.1 hypothetical protein [Campylobacter lari]
MSNLNTQIFNTNLEKQGTSVLNSKHFMELLNYLEVINSNEEKELNYAKLSSKVSEILDDAQNENAVLNAKNIEELLVIFKNFNLTHENLKLDCAAQLQNLFPNLAKNNFLVG